MNKKDIAVNKLKSLGDRIIEDVHQNNVPAIKVPSRGTSNIVYDDAKALLRAGRSLRKTIPG